MRSATLFLPTMLGWISDLEGLRAALLVAPVMILVAAFFCFVCARFIEEDTAKVGS